MTFWHCDCICHVSENAFTERYQKWCNRKGYHFSEEKAKDIYAGSCGHFTTLPKNDNTKLLITTAARQLLAGKMTLAALRTEMTRLGRSFGFPAAVPSLDLQALTLEWTALASTTPRAFPLPNAAPHICAKRCTRLSALT
mgnify:CR=1 FL=1